MASAAVVILILVGLVPACSSDEATANTYADENGHLYYASDCPEVDPALLAAPDGLPNVESTTFEAVEAEAQRDPQYRVIARNGWVWERLSDGSVHVFQAEDYMLERTIESTEDCPTVYMFPSGIPVAYKVAD